MKTLATAAIIAIMFATSAMGAGFAVSGFLGDEIINLRGGIERGRLEFGVQGEATTINNFWEQDCTLDDTFVGGYSDIAIDLGKKWNITPFVGLQGTYGLDTSGWQGGPEAGVRFYLHDQLHVGVIVQHRWHTGDVADKYEDGVNWLVGAGIRF